MKNSTEDKQKLFAPNGDIRKGMDKCNNEHLDENYHKRKIEEIFNSFQESSNPVNFKFPRLNLLRNLHSRIMNTGFVFIESPLLKGKTTLLLDYEKWLTESKEYYTNINEGSEKKNSTLKRIYIYDVLSNYTYIPENIVKVNDLYHFWGKSLLMHLFDNQYLDKSKLTDGHKKLIYGDKDVFIDKIESLYEENDYIRFAAFLDIVQQIITKYSDTTLIIFFIIRLEDFHKYINDNRIYTLFTNDIFKYTSDLEYTIEILESIKLLVTTRVFPAKRPSRIVYYINNFSKEETLEFIKDALKLNDVCCKAINDIVFNYTSGHPWFINRFLELFFVLYNKEENPIKITYDIFSKKNYWLENKIFKRNDNTIFYRELIEIFKKSENSLDANTLRFLGESEYKAGSFDIYKQNSIIQEAGLIDFRSDDDMNLDILGYGNIVIKDFIINKVIELQNEK